MKVLISGAGPAGLTAAYWLRRYVFSPTIVERAPSLLVGGYKIDVRGAALQVLRQTGVHDAVVAAHTDMQEAVLVDKEGNVINRMSGDNFGHRVGEDIEIVRGTLCQILRDHLGDLEVLFGDTIQAITQTADSTQVQFTKNGVREFDLVIGADGLHSNVRRIVFGEESRFLRDLGLYLCVYSVPNYLKLDRMEIQYSELGRLLRSGVLEVIRMPRPALALRPRLFGLICNPGFSSSKRSDRSMRESAGRSLGFWK
jgi:2-polyprenyl-6-methoxyphenol hydroxylase-like FAD-dependent oxidoreductase